MRYIIKPPNKDLITGSWIYQCPYCGQTHRMESKKDDWNEACPGCVVTILTPGYWR